jgi:hypothetical protein
MKLLATSASGMNRNGYGTVLSFDLDGQLQGPFSTDDRISDPRGFCLDPTSELVYLNSGPDRILALDDKGVVTLDSGRMNGLDPGGAVFAPDGRYCVTVRRRGTILAISPNLDGPGAPLLPDGSVPFPRGFGFDPDGTVYLSSGIGPTGEGDNTIAVFSQNGTVIEPRLVDDPEFSPLDLTIAPNGNLLVNSEWPFGDPKAKVTTREYEPSSGTLVRVFSVPDSIGFARPRGLRLTANGRLYSVGKDHVIAFDFASGHFLGVVAQLTGLYGQAVLVVPGL